MFFNYPINGFEDNSGNIYVAYNNGSTGNLMKLDNLGNIYWSKGYNGYINGFNQIYFTDNKNKLIALAEKDDSLGFVNSYLVKLDSSGNLIWNKNISDSSNINYLYPSDNSYYLCGSIGNGQPTTGFITKRDTAGNKVWKKFLPITSKRFSLDAITANSENSFMAIGNLCLFSYDYCGLYALKFNSSGEIIWQRDYKEDSLTGIRITKTTTNNFVISPGGNTGREVISMIDSSGSLLFKKTHYYNPDNLIFYGQINNCLDSGFIISGEFNITSNHYSDCLIVKTDKLLSLSTVGIIMNNIILSELKISVYPNPFNSITKINYSIPSQGLVTLKIYDVLGREVAVLINEIMQPGNYVTEFNGTNLGSGIYYCKLQTAGFAETKKMVLIK